MTGNSGTAIHHRYKRVEVMERVRQENHAIPQSIQVGIGSESFTLD